MTPEQKALAEQRLALLAEYEAIDMAELTDYVELSKHACKRNALRKQITEVTKDLMALQEPTPSGRATHNDNRLVYMVGYNERAKKWRFNVDSHGVLILSGRSYVQKRYVTYIVNKLITESGGAIIQEK